LIKPIEEENKTASGIVLPDSSKEKPSRWKIVAVWNWKILENWQRWTMDVKVWDIVHFTKYSPDELEVMENWTKVKYLIVKHSSILAVEQE
jgi:chaperonin GroES